MRSLPREGHYVAPLPAKSAVFAIMQRREDTIPLRCECEILRKGMRPSVSPPCGICVADCFTGEYFTIPIPLRTSTLAQLGNFFASPLRLNAYHLVSVSSQYETTAPVRHYAFVWTPPDISDSSRSQEGRPKSRRNQGLLDQQNLHSLGF